MRGQWRRGRGEGEGEEGDKVRWQYSRAELTQKRTHRYKNKLDVKMSKNQLGLVVHVIKYVGGRCGSQWECTG